MWLPSRDTWQLPHRTSPRALKENNCPKAGIGPLSIDLRSISLNRRNNLFRSLLFCFNPFSPPVGIRPRDPNVVPDPMCHACSCPDHLIIRSFPAVTHLSQGYGWTHVPPTRFLSAKHPRIFFLRFPVDSMVPQCPDGDPPASSAFAHSDVRRRFAIHLPGLY